MAHQYDLIIRGGTVVDGSGGAPFEADVAISGGKIAAVGKISGQGHEEISAKGKIVTPGFVDIHTHYDGQITWENTLAPSSHHGVTTVLMGNCGVGFAPCQPSDRERLIKLMEGVEDIPEVVMTEGLPWNWQTFPEYMDALAARACDIDFATQVPHSPVRVYVMGERGANREPPTQDDLTRMTELVREGIKAGALGVSTSRCLSHRTRKGDLAPSVDTEEAELSALALGLRQAGTGVFQMIPRTATDEADPWAEMAMLRRLAKISGRPLSFTLLHKADRVEQLSIILNEVKEAKSEGLIIRPQIFNRPLGFLAGLDLSFHPFRFRPSYKAIAHLPLPEIVAAMRQPEMKARLLAEQPEHTNPMFVRVTSQIDTLSELGDPPNYEPGWEDTMAARAAALGVTPTELVYELLLKNDGHNILLWPAANFVDHTLNPIHALMQDEDTLLALGDGGAHYGMICDSSHTTYLLTYWTRDRQRGPRLSLPQAVRAITSDTAAAVGLHDRGLIRPGYKADLNIIDYDRLRLHAPYVRRDLPAGGRRLHQKADGYVATIVSGQITYRDGEPTGALPGRLIRGAQHL
jgi:N-acyl-D-amino-acid deacylase